MAYQCRFTVRVQFVYAIWEHVGNTSGRSDDHSRQRPRSMQQKNTVRPTGHLQVKGKRGDRAFYALVRDAEGRHQRRLGPAWVKDSGKRTPRGAVRWVTRDGPKPDGYLTPPDAEDLLKQILAAAPRRAARS